MLDCNSTNVNNKSMRFNNGRDNISNISQKIAFIWPMHISMAINRFFVVFTN